MRNIILQILILLVFSPYSFSQNLSLDNCIEYAYANRVELKTQENSQSYYKNIYQYSKYELLPSVYSETDLYFSGYKTYNQTQENYKYNSNENGLWSIYAELILFDGFQTINKIKQSKTLISRNDTYTQSIENTIKLEVIQAYYAILMAQENIIITKQAIETTKQQITYIEISVESGKTSEIDLLEIKAQFENEYSYYINSKKQYEIAQIQLKKSINNIDFDSIIINPIIKNDLKNNIINTDSIYLLAINLLPEFKTATYDSLYWHYAIKQTKGAYLPYLTGNATLATSYNRRASNYLNPTNKYKFNNQLENNFNNQIGLSLIIPIYSNHAIKAIQSKNKMQLKDINLEKEQLYKNIYFEIEELCKETQRQQEKIKTIKKRLNYYTTIYNMRAEQYKQGILSINDLLIADTNKKKTELNLSYEKYTLLYKLKVIDFYSGKI